MMLVRRFSGRKKNRCRVIRCGNFIVDDLNLWKRETTFCSPLLCLMMCLHMEQFFESASQRGMFAASKHAAEPTTFPTHSSEPRNSHAMSDGSKPAHFVFNHRRTKLNSKHKTIVHFMVHYCKLVRWLDDAIKIVSRHRGAAIKIVNWSNLMRNCLMMSQLSKSQLEKPPSDMFVSAFYYYCSTESFTPC